MRNRSIVTFIMLILTALMLSGCILVPLPVGDGDGHRDGHYDNGRHGGDRH